MKRKRYSNELKSKIALAAIKGDQTSNEIASEFGVHVSQVNRWKKEAIDKLPEVFSNKAAKNSKDIEKEKDSLYQQIGKLKVEVDFLKKKHRSLDSNLAQKRDQVQEDYPKLSIQRQCELLGLQRSSYYRKPSSSEEESQKNLSLMRMIDQEYTDHPFYGTRQMRNYLRRLDFKVNRKRVQRLMRQMGLQSVAPKPKTSRRCHEHKVYPYLLRNMNIARPDQVHCSDITYIRLQGGFVYLTAIMDWHSRFVFSWEVSVSMDSEFCTSALERSLRLFGPPEIFNTDQGSQYTSNEFTGILKTNGVRISMDGKGRAMDNIFIERLWRSVKYEEIYLKEYESVAELKTALKKYFNFYNYERSHSSLGGKIPADIYFSPGQVAKAA